MYKNIVLLLFILFLWVACKQSPVLKDTVLSLKEIKEIGELVTAEYYGEVISGHSLLLVNERVDPVFYKSLEKIRNELAMNREKIGKEFDAGITADTIEIGRINDKKIVLFRNRKIEKLKKKVEKKEKKKEKKQATIATKIHSEDYEASIKILLDATGIKRKKLLLELIESEKNDTVIYETYKTNIKDYFVADKKELVYIGRGAVKVGYNLKQLDSTNIFFSENRDTVYLLDFDPYITDLDINPYFFYPSDSANKDQDTVFFGFQIIYQNNQKKFTLEEVNKIKSDCKIQLRQEALKRDIYSNAHKNAEEALHTFFSLLKSENDRQIEKVIISHSKYFYYKSDFLYDLRIDSSEFREIEELIHQDLDSLDIESFKYQTLEYQQQHLDKFINELYKTAQYSNNYQKWDSLYTDYSNRNYQ
ncbi:DUF4230 domain-containing protein [uncultured Draconibacterium sp.]|uniref:DUF4230 domain-containing protein n=1 Tax=uncultured Draconibacterium sp. TaxID=1573823 RepID=UPI0032166F55